MSDARTAILERIRAANREQQGAETIDAWLRQPRVGAQPHWDGDRESRFIGKLEQAGASVERVDGAQAIVAALKRFRQRHALGGPLLSAATPLLKSMGWPGDMSVDYRPAQSQDQIVLSEAFCAVAETGSLVLRSGQETPTTLNFLPEYFVCVVRTSTIVDWIEDVWIRLREQGALPRAVNFVTGPSRTADVEQTIQMGAHGPRHVHVLLLDE